MGARGCVSILSKARPGSSARPSAASPDCNISAKTADLKTLPVAMGPAEGLTWKRRSAKQRVGVSDWLPTHTRRWQTVPSHTLTRPTKSPPHFARPGAPPNAAQPGQDPRAARPAAHRLDVHARASFGERGGGERNGLLPGEPTRGRRHALARAQRNSGLRWVPAPVPEVLPASRARPAARARGHAGALTSCLHLRDDVVLVSARLC